MILGTVAEFDLADLDRLHRTNIRGTFVVAQHAARRLRAGGAIITFSSSQTRLRFPGYDQDAIDNLAAQPSLQRLGTPADIAETVAFLAGPGRWVNGQVLFANGGIA